MMCDLDSLVPLYRDLPEVDSLRSNTTFRQTGSESRFNERFCSFETIITFTLSESSSEDIFWAILTKRNRKLDGSLYRLVLVIFIISFFGKGKLKECLFLQEPSLQCIQSDIEQSQSCINCTVLYYVMSVLICVTKQKKKKSVRQSLWTCRCLER